MIATYSLLVLTGFCVCAAVSHFSVALRRPVDTTHLLFALICVTTVGFGLTHALAYHAPSIDAYVTAIKWNITLVIAMYMLMPWFIAQHTGVRPLSWLVFASAIGAALFVLNAFAPYSIQYNSIEQLDSMRLPWGETITQPVGKTGVLLMAGSAWIVANLVFALYAFSVAWRRKRSRVAAAMLFSVVILIGGVTQGVFVRNGTLSFIHLGPYGQLLMIVVMSIALSHHTRGQLLSSERRFRSMVEQSPFSIQVLTPDGRTRQVNPAFEKLWGVTRDTLVEYNILEDRQLMELGIMPYIKQGFAGSAAEIPPIMYNPAENPVARGPYRNRWVQASIYPLRDLSGAIRDVVLVHQDVTAHKRTEDAIRLIAAGVSPVTGEEFAQQLVLNLAKVLDAEYAFIGLLNEQAHEIDTLALCARGALAPNIRYALAGTPCDTVVGQRACIYPRDVQGSFPEDTLLADMQAEAYIGIPLFDTQQRPLGLIVVLDSKPIENIEQTREILEIFAARAGAELQRRQAESRIRYLAYQDYLTGLANRAQLSQRLSDALHRARRTGTDGALLLVDLDHFKTINDALGHDIGDTLLQDVARRLVEVATPRAFVARFGGDEFVVLIEPDDSGVSVSEQDAMSLARRILEKFTSPITVGERSFTVGASVGVSMFPQSDQTEADVLRHADMALYRAKRMGRGLIQLYQPKFQDESANRLLIESGLRRAVANNELELHYQPQFNAAGRVTGAELLLRWHHPELGMLSPAEFIPIAEETGLIHPIGAWVIENACARINEWSLRDIPFTGTLSVNVCPWQFARPDFVDEVRNAFTSSNTDPRRLVLELTETALLLDIDDAVDKLKALRDMGLTMALDDFGTGYSSLSYLRDLPLDQIKIDKSFVAELDRFAEHPLVESIIDIGRHMKLVRIAEGVETESQHAKLIKLGCEHFQGYLFCRPLPEAEFLKWLNNYVSRPAGTKAQPDGA